MVYMYEPFTHTVTKTDLSHLHNITGIPLNTLWYQKERGTYNDKLKCFFTDTMPRMNKKQEFNERVVAKDEIWKYSEKYDLYVSNLGRMKRPDGKYKFANGCNGISTVIYKNKKYRAADIVYETFIGNLKTDHTHIRKIVDTTTLLQITYSNLHYKNIECIAEIKVYLNQYI